MARRSYSGNAVATTLNGAMTNTSTSLTVLDATGFPSAITAPFVITVDTGLAAEEKILVGTRSGTTFSTLTRGFDGTTASAHATGASVKHTISAVDLDEANAHLNAATSHVGLVVQSVSSGLVGLVVKGLASQSGDLQQWQDSTGALLASVSAAGRVLGTQLFALPTAPSAVAVIVKSASGQTGDLTQWQDNTGTSIASVSSFGRLLGTQLFSLVASPTGVGAVVKGAASQSANLQEWQNSAGTPVASINAAGQVAATASGLFRTLELGAADSAGTGYRTVRVLN